MGLTDILGLIIVILLWEISYNVKALNNNLIEIMKWLDKKYGSN